MKIIARDNLDRDNVDDVLVAENVTDKEYATIMIEALNEKLCDEHSSTSRYFAIEADDYKLKVWEP